MVGPTGYVAIEYLRAQYSVRGTVLLRRTPNGTYRPHLRQHKALGDYDYFTDGNTLYHPQSLSDGSYSVNCTVPYLMAAESLRLYQAPRLYEATKDVMIKTVPLLVVDDGVPGAGKTTKQIFEAPDGALLLTAFKETAIETREKLLARRPDSNITVHTIDSYLLNHRTKADIVYIDEIFAVHAGTIAIIAALTNASVIRGFGDSCQLPAISRVFSFPFLYNKLFDHHVDKVTTTNRCPADVCASLRPTYKNFLTRNPVVTSLKRVRIFSLDDIPYSPAVRYMTFTQAEKQQLTDYLKKNHGNFHYKVTTVHEAQGTQARNTALVRINTKKLVIFQSQPHVTVALTRHTAQHTYYTFTSE